MKIVVIGSSGVGKTTILGRYLNGTVDKDTKCTIGNVHAETIISNGEELLKAVLWDTAGQERFRTITSSYYRGAHGIIVSGSVLLNPLSTPFEITRFWPILILPSKKL